MQYRYVCARGDACAYISHEHVCTKTQHYVLQYMQVTYALKTCIHLCVILYNPKTLCKDVGWSIQDSEKLVTSGPCELFPELETKKGRKGRTTEGHGKDTGRTREGRVEDKWRTREGRVEDKWRCEFSWHSCSGHYLSELSVFG